MADEKKAPAVKRAPSPEHALRESAAAFLACIEAAEKAGLKVTWPYRASGLASIEISETGKAGR